MKYIIFLIWRLSFVEFLPRALDSSIDSLNTSLKKSFYLSLSPFPYSFLAGFPRRALSNLWISPLSRNGEAAVPNSAFLLLQERQGRSGKGSIYKMWSRGWSFFRIIRPSPSIALHKEWFFCVCEEYSNLVQDKSSNYARLGALGIRGERGPSPFSRRSVSHGNLDQLRWRSETRKEDEVVLFIRVLVRDLPILQAPIWPWVDYSYCFFNFGPKFLSVFLPSLIVFIDLSLDF